MFDSKRQFGDCVLFKKVARFANAYCELRIQSFEYLTNSEF